MHGKSIAEHSEILSTCIKLPSVLKTFVLSIFDWPLKTGFTVIFKSSNELGHSKVYKVACAPIEAYKNPS